MKRALLLLVLLASAAPGLLAHEVRPAYLELRETSAESYAVLWKVPARGEDLRLGIYVRLPENCNQVGEARRSFVSAAFTDRWNVKCPGGLASQTIHIEGLSSTVIDVLVRLERLDGTTQVTRLMPSAPSFVVESAPSRFQVATTYLRLGTEHILLGIDHLLFVLGLLLIVGRRWTVLLKTITAFTLAHSITLALATLGVVRIPQAPVEAVIALSIMFVAAEILHIRAGRPGLTARAPWVVAFTFGLLHGFGFAGALSEVGLPQQSIPLALLLFNLGVEIGQLLFVGSALLAAHALRRLNARWPAWAEALPAYSSGAFAALLFLQRVSAMFWQP